MDMGKYVRKQAIMSGLSLNLRDLKKQREELCMHLSRLDNMIDRHVTYLQLLENDKEQ